MGEMKEGDGCLLCAGDYNKLAVMMSVERCGDLIPGNC